MVIRPRPAAAVCFLAFLSAILTGVLLISRPGLSTHVWRKASSFMAAKPKAGSLHEWLAAQKQAYLHDLQSGSSMTDWILTAGNEAGDLDSLSSAVGLSYLSSRYTANAGRHIPLIQSARDDLRLRRENERSLSDAGVSPEALLWLDEAGVEAAFERHARLMLVDHNRAASRFGDQPDVRGVIDHHQDEGLYKDAAPRKVITGIGSCSSLVATSYAQFWETHDVSPILSSLASLLSDAILIDTANLKSVPGKASDTDYAAFSLLTRYLPSSSSYADLAFSPSARPPSDRFDTLSKLKFSISHLAPRDLLRRDYKEFSTASGRRLGFSSVPKKLDEWSWQGPLTDWAQEHDLDVAFILTSYENKNAKRRKDVVALVPRAASDSQLKEAVFSQLSVVGGEGLKLEAKGDVQDLVGGAQVAVWKQGETSATRKQVAPAALKALELLPARPAPNSTAPGVSSSASAP